MASVSQSCFFFVQAFMLYRPGRNCKRRGVPEIGQGRAGGKFLRGRRVAAAIGHARALLM
jgi:hypothetical protein